MACQVVSDRLRTRLRKPQVGHGTMVDIDAVGKPDDLDAGLGRQPAQAHDQRVQGDAALGGEARQIATPEREQGVGPESQALGARRGPRRRRRRGERHRTARGRLLRLVGQILGHLNGRVGMQPAKLGRLIARVHEFDLGAGGGLGCALSPGVGLQGREPRPQVRSNPGRAVDQWRVLRHRDLAGLETRDDQLALFERRPREVGAVVAGVLEVADVDPALRLGHRVVRKPVAAVVERLQALLEPAVDRLVPHPHLVSDPRGRGRQRGLACRGSPTRGAVQNGAQQQDRQGLQGMPEGRFAVGHTGPHGFCGTAGLSVRLTAGSSLLNRSSSNL